MCRPVVGVEAKFRLNWFMIVNEPCRGWLVCPSLGQPRIDGLFIQWLALSNYSSEFNIWIYAKFPIPIPKMSWFYQLRSTLTRSTDRQYVKVYPRSPGFAACFGSLRDISTRQAAITLLSTLSLSLVEGIRDRHIVNDLQKAILDQETGCCSDPLDQLSALTPE